MDTPNKVVYSSTSYVREDLENFTVDSYEMQFPRGLWGEDKRVCVTCYDDANFSDNFGRLVESVQKEIFTQKDSFVVDAKVVGADSFNFGENEPKRCLVVKHNDTIGFSDYYNHYIKKIKKEAVKVYENTNRYVSNKNTDSFNFDELYSKDVRLKSTEDVITLNDDVMLRLNNVVEESFSVFDEDERKPHNVIYDIEFDNAPLSQNDFINYYSKTTPLNYSALQPLIPGEYEYKNAIVGVQMDIPPTQGRFGVIGSTLHIDVEDTVEKGTAILTSSGPTTVRLNKKFYTIPHVLTSLVESEGVGVIEVSEVGKDYFTIGLKSLTNPTEYVSGTVDWLVDGY